MEGKDFTLLIEAIIKRAAQDYFDLLAGFILPTNDCNVAEIEAFFRSDYFAPMSRIDPDYIMERIREEAANNGTGIYRSERERQ